MIESGLPSPDALLASSSPWFSAMFDELFPFAYIEIGIVVAVSLVIMLVLVFKNGVGRLVHHVGHDPNSVDASWHPYPWKK